MTPVYFSSAAGAIDHGVIGRRQIEIVAGCTLALILDGLDLQLLAFAAPLLLVEWGISRAELGPAMSAAFVGMAIGNALGGWLGDRFGRKKTILWSIAWFGAVTWATSVVADTTQLTAIRFLGGIGFGAAVPNAVALASEWTPARRRSLVIGALVLGAPIGGSLGSAAAAMLIDEHGWRFLFAASGMLTFAACVVLALRLVESPGFIEKRGRREAAEKLLSNVLGPVRLEHASASSAPAAEQRPRGSFMQLFDAGNRRTNACLFLAFFANAYFGFSLLAWMPVVLSGAGLPLATALNGSLSYNVASGLGVALGAIIAPRLGSKFAATLMIAGLLLSAAFLLHLLQQPLHGPAVGLLFGALATAGLSSGALQTTLYSLSSSAYSVEYRATGLGMVSASSRVGGILASLCGGVLLSIAPDGGSEIFLLSLMVMVLAAAAALGFFDRHWARPLQRTEAA